MSFLVGAGAEPTGGTADVVDGEGIGLFPGDSCAGGDQGIDGRALVMLLRDIDFDGSFGTWPLASA